MTQKYTSANIHKLEEYKKRESNFALGLILFTFLSACVYSFFMVLLYICVAVESLSSNINL